MSKSNDGLARRDGSAKEWFAMVNATKSGPLLIKLGGHVASDPVILGELGSELAKLSTPTVVVHGGGAEVDKWCDALKIPTQKLDGLRVTDTASPAW